MNELWKQKDPEKYIAIESSEIGQAPSVVCLSPHYGPTMGPTMVLWHHSIVWIKKAKLATNTQGFPVFMHVLPLFCNIFCYQFLKAQLKYIKLHRTFHDLQGQKESPLSTEIVL